MMQKIRMGYMFAVVAAVAGSPVCADELGSAAVTLKSRTGFADQLSKPCVLLRNDNVLFGQAQQVGEFVIVRTGQGSEMQLARKDVACWADSIRHLYQFRIDHRQKGDVGAHLRDARWCVRYDLYDLADTEIQAIKEIDPKNVQAMIIENQLRRLKTPRAKVEPIPEMPSPVVQTSGFTDDGADSESVDLPTLRRFASHVQPMLVNRCGRCHGRDSKLQWTLDVPLGGARASSRMTRRNLAALLTYIERGVDGESDFLSKATTPHGGGPAPLELRNAKAVDSLRQWLLMAQHRISIPPTNRRGSDHNVKSVDPLANPRFAQHNVPSGDAGPLSDAGDQPVRLPQVANPFDPDLFNRRLTLDAASE
jgi:hypothetical protein